MEAGEIDLEPRDELMVEVAERDNGMKQGASSGQGPIDDAVVFGFGGVVASSCEVIADKLDTFLEEVALVEFQGEAVLNADAENIGEVLEEPGNGGRVQENIINYDFTASDARGGGGSCEGNTSGLWGWVRGGREGQGSGSRSRGNCEGNTSGLWGWVHGGREGQGSGSRGKGKRLRNGRVNGSGQEKGGDRAGGEPEQEAVVPFIAHDLHHTRVGGRGIAGSKGEDGEAVFAVVWGKEGQFLLVALADMKLMVSRAGVEGDEVQSAIAIPQILNGVIAARDGICKRKGHCIEFAIADAHTPNEVIDIRDVFLVGFRG